MHRFFAGVWVVAMAVLGLACQAPKPASQTVRTAAPNQVLLISLDGFRADYLDKTDAPNLRRLAREGVRAAWMNPSFPSKTFPNHYTLVTGLYPDHHGLVENTMYDAETKAVFSLSNRAEVTHPRWWGGEPIWVTAEKQGQKAATLFWPGSEAPIQGIRPSYWLPYHGDMTASARVDTVMAWLQKPALHRPSFVTLYFSTTDDAGHAHGPDSEEVKTAIQTVDTALGDLIQRLEKAGLWHKINIVITADHGMTEVSKDRVIVLDDYLNLDDMERYHGSEMAQFWPKAGKEEAVYQALKKMPHVQVYRKTEVPAVYHYGTHPRVAPLLSISDGGWLQMSRKAYERVLANPNAGKGAHGYDHTLPDMRATFIAHGPAFKKGFTAPPFDNIHVYSLLCHLLGLPPAPNDGNLAPLQPILR